jgi:dTDP-glucose pyrophosphorylase
VHNFRDCILSPDASIHKAIATIEATSAKIVLIVDADDRLLGTVTDGDIRRAILRGCSLESPASAVMNGSPRTLPAVNDEPALLAQMRRHSLRHLPLIDERGRLVGLATLAELLQLQAQENWVVLMAGGRGRRLHPLTENLPKPLLSVGSKPILEVIVDSFILAGCTKFFIAVNYLAAQVESYFGDGKSRGIEIAYLREEKPLGTAGAISLLPGRPTAPFFVMNCDILTRVDFSRLLEFHQEHRAVATMCVREEIFQVPYGVVELTAHRLSSISEKPMIRNFVNAGIYVFDPSVIDHVPMDQQVDMPELFSRLLSVDQECVAFPLREYWIDIGHPDQFVRAQADFERGLS